jgi:hypothetical protein
MLSIGELVDKLVVETMKGHYLRDKLHGLKEEDPEYLDLYQKLMISNDNRGIVSNLLDEKVDKVVMGGQNVIVKRFKTY